MTDWTGITVANAPVSYGAFELTVGIDPSTPDGVQVLDEVTAAGYAGIDLGPVGYLGSGTELADRLASRGLGLAGAYLELPYSDHDALERVLPELDAMLDTFDAVAGRLPGPPPHPTIADAGSPARRARPGRSHADPSLGLDDDGWRRFGVGLTGCWPGAGAGATNPPSTTRPVPTSKPRGRSTGSWTSATSASASTPVTTSWAAATRSSCSPSGVVG